MNAIVILSSMIRIPSVTDYSRAAMIIGAPTRQRLRCPRTIEFTMTRQIRFNAFDMNSVGHQSLGLWAHPRDRSWQYKDLEYWTDVAQTLERVACREMTGGRFRLHGRPRRCVA
jgi:hypothetical protein